mmetsp:Transcript_10692/g.43253  ORF Transcript_10692/g.43253 Transcript_10692/m.43253 type:complete len:201 (-) Transcript_10692:245-847(-)
MFPKMIVDEITSVAMASHREPLTPRSSMTVSPSAMEVSDRTESATTCESAEPMFRRLHRDDDSASPPPPGSGGAVVSSAAPPFSVMDEISSLDGDVVAALSPCPPNFSGPHFRNAASTRPSKTTPKTPKTSTTSASRSSLSRPAVKSSTAPERPQSVMPYRTTIDTPDVTRARRARSRGEIGALSASSSLAAHSVCRFPA